MTLDEIFATSNVQALSWHSFENILTNSPLNERIDIELNKLPVDEACQYLWELSDKNLQAEELATLQVLASIIYLLPDDQKLLKKARRVLLRKSFQAQASLDPMLVHYFSENLLNYFNLSRRSNVGFILNIANFISTKCALGKAVAVCLFWGIVFQCGESPILIHQHRDLGELNGILRDVPLDTISMDIFCILLHTVGCLLHLMLCNKWQSEFQANGYSSFYFRLLPQDRLNLRAWLQQSLQSIQSQYRKIPHRIRCEADKILASMDYLESNSAQWCLVCQSESSEKTEVCVLGQINNIYDCSKV
ncbi:uncharacterized protein LOC117786502 [Drosophila innubila]|uniref:uncharacterized protein LOC117786502 n=1 Tax=Drosophila innubila TaxID=198719 RepID=UPI00148CAF11|nr:uncharacterized protein LOC117786502 [Drosophila innubila]